MGCPCLNSIRLRLGQDLALLGNAEASERGFTTAAGC
jgi:hypothetical protein